MKIVRVENAAEIFKVPFESLHDLFLCGVLVAKIPHDSEDAELDLALGLSDIFLKSTIDAAVSGGLHQLDVPNSSEPQRAIANALSALLGSIFDEDVEAVNKQEKVGFAQYFGERLENWLRILRDGDSMNTPTVTEFEVIGKDELSVPTFRVRVLRSAILEGFKQNLADFIAITSKAYLKLLAVTDLSNPAVSSEKQIDFLRNHLDERARVTGETRFSFLLSQVNFRRAVMQFEGSGGQGLIPSPLSDGDDLKVLLPFLLEMQGELDIEQVKIITPLDEIDGIDLQFSVRRPAVRNAYGATYCALLPGTRSRMSPVEVNAYEEITHGLQRNLCFLKRRDLEVQFAELAPWIIQKVVYCLEESSYLAEPARRWLAENGSEKYQAMEDKFFLPFLYEKLRERFGAKVSMKPARFGGNVDILFGDIPIELKVRKDQRDALVETMVDEKYKPSGQAAAYAAVTRLGCVLVLDIPTSAPQLTNLSACIKIVTRHFPEAPYPTSVPVFIFHCNSPKPSSAA